MRLKIPIFVKKMCTDLRFSSILQITKSRTTFKQVFRLYKKEKKTLGNVVVKIVFYSIGAICSTNSETFLNSSKCGFLPTSPKSHCLLPCCLVGAGSYVPSYFCKNLSLPSHTKTKGFTNGKSIRFFSGFFLA